MSLLCREAGTPGNTATSTMLHRLGSTPVKVLARGHSPSEVRSNLIRCNDTTMLEIAMEENGY